MTGSIGLLGMANWGGIMGSATTVLRVADIDAPLAQAWDELPAGRGIQADHYDSYAWLAAWCSIADAATVASVRIPAVLDGDRPLALLPLVARSRRRWASSWQGASRLRHRPVLGTEQPEREPLGLLADEVARTGVRELTLRLPARDPATAAMATALRQAGFHVHQRQWSGEYLALVEGGWAGFSQRFAGCQRSARKLARRLRPLWEVTLDEYGPGTGVPVADGYAIYTDLYSRSWKPPLSDRWERYELELLRRTEALGWARVYVLRVAGVPAAAQLWCRLGDVAISIGTVYDRRMAAISPGTMSEWPVQERLFTSSPPRLVDYLPGAANQLKERLGPDRPPLVRLEAARRTLVAGTAFPLRREFRALHPAATPARTLGRRVAARLRPPTRRERPRVRRLEIQPGPPTLPVATLELDTPVRRFLAVAGGHASPEAMARRWAKGDSWWRVGDGPEAFVRLGAGGRAGRRPLREAVLLDTGALTVEALVDALAAEVKAAVFADLPADARSAGAVPGRPADLYRPVLPWPRRSPRNPEERQPVLAVAALAGRARPGGRPTFLDDDPGLVVQAPASRRRKPRTG